MKLRSPTETPVHVALLSGHSIVIGSELRDVPIQFRREALARGCLPEGVNVEDIDPKLADPTDKTNEQLIKDGIKKMLEENIESNFVNGTGMPNRKILSNLIGINVTAEELTVAWQELEAEAA